VSKDFRLEAGNNSIKFYADNLSASFHCKDFKYKEYFLIATGSVDAKIKNLAV
jgi:hypothetical protein